MWKKTFLAFVIAASAPFLANCAASGSGGVSAGDEGVSGSASGSATAGDDDARSTSTTKTR